MKKIIQLLLLIFVTNGAFSQFINVSGVAATGRFASCGGAQLPTITAELINLNGGAVVNGGVFTCNNGCDSSTVRVTMSNISWNQNPNAEWLHGLFLPANAGFVVSAISIPAGFITYNPGCVGMCPSGSGFNGGPGFYFDNTAANTCCNFILANDGLPCNNYGDVTLGCNTVFNLIFDIKFCNSIITNNSYTFVLDGSSDGETGCWNFNDLLSHKIQFTIATNPCTPPPINPTATDPVRSCVGNNLNYTSTLTGLCNNNVISWWDDPIAGNLVGTGSPFVYDPAGAACPAGTTLYATCCTGNIAGCLSRVPITIPGTCTVLTITNVNITNATCFQLGSINATTVANAIGAINYNLNPGGLNNATGIFTGLNQIVYTLTVTDATGCTASTVVNITQPPPIVIAPPIISGTTCALPNSGQIIVSAVGGNGGLIYSISPIATQAPPGTFTGLSAQSYTITVTDALGCTATTVVIIPNSPPVNWVSVIATDVLCNGGATGTITASAGGGLSPYTYTLLPGGLNNNTGVFTGLLPNAYTVTVVDVNGCSTTTIKIIASPALLTWASVVDVDVLCANGNTGSIAATATGGIPNYQYNLMPGNVNNASGIFNTLLIGIYTVTATDVNGCTVTTVVNITQPPAINFTISTATAVQCNGANTGIINVAAVGGNGSFIYTLNPGNISNLSGIFTNLIAGSYTITATDANNCTLTTVISVLQPLPITFPTVVTASPTCAGLLNGSISVVAAGGTGTITYTLNPIGTVNITGNFSGLAAGTYTVIASDINLCTASTVIVIAPPIAITFPVVNITQVLCNGALTGSINVVAAGGAGGFSYLLQPGGILNNTGIFTGLGADSYTITVLDANNCSNSTIAIITQPAALLWNNVTIVNATCNGATNGSISANVVGGVGAISYTLNPPGITNNTGIFANLAGGSYTVTASDVNGCSITTVVNIVNPPLLTIINVTILPPNCVPGNNGEVTINISGGVAPFNYNIGAGNQPGNIFYNVGQGTYTVVVTDANNCTATSVVNIITPNSPLFTNVVVQNVNCFGGANGNITAIATGGNGQITYVMQPGNITNFTGLFPNLPAGTYTITGTDINNCSTQTIVTITAPILIIIDSVTHQDILCNNGNTGSIQVYASGGVPPLSYTLQPGNITNNTGIFNNLAIGNYVITITDANGCFVTTNVNIIQLPIMNWVNVTFVSVSCAGGNTGSIQATVIGGTPPITYTLQPTNQTNLTGTFTGLATGFYVVTATDLNGCTTTININLTQPSPVVINSITSTVPSCVPGFDGTITILVSGGTAPYNYQIGAINQANNVIVGLNPGIYTIIVTDASGCTATSSYNLVAPVAPVITNITSTPILCNGGNNGTINVVAVGGVGPLNYTLLPNNISNGIGVFTNLIGGIYTVVVGDVLGCTTSSVVSIVDPPLLQYATVVVSNPTCYGGTNGTITATATGGTGIYTYLLNPGAINNNTGIFNNIAIGNYTITVTDINNCTSSTIVVVTQPTQVVWVNATFVSPSCNGSFDGTINVSATGGIGIMDYNIQPGNVTNQTGLFINLAVGIYTIIAADQVGCSITTTVNVTQPPALAIVNVASTPPSCVPGNDGTITIAVTGGTPLYAYNIGGANQASNTFIGLAGGTYTITITDANNCTLTNVVSLTTPGAPTIANVTPVNASCNGSNDGSITVVISGGTPPITYTLLPGGAINNTGIFIGLGPNIYTINVTDANGCTTVATATITAPTSIIFTSLSNTSINCFGGNDGTITAIVTGGIGLITYNMMPGNVNNNTGLFSNLIAGVYTITATDMNGCNTVSTTTIIAPTLLVWANVLVTNVTCNNGNDGSIAATTSGGTGIITYTLLPNNVNNITGIFGNLLVGVYTVQAQDANGCSINTTITILQSTPIVIANIATTIPTCVPGNDATVNIAANGGVLPYNYNIGFGNQLGNIFNNVGAGNYTVTITDANGCTATSAFVVTNPGSPTITNVLTTNTLCFGANNGNITISASGGIGALTYTLLPNNINNLTGLFANLIAGVYTINVTDASNCSVSTLVTITQPNALIISGATINNILCFGATNGDVTVTTVGGTGIINFTLLPNNITNQTGYFNNLNAGSYTINCVDANGCNTSTVFSIVSPTLLVMGVPILNNVLCYNGNDGNISITATGGTGNISYTIQPLGITNNTGLFISLAIGTYTVIATDVNGCSTSSIISVTQPQQMQLVNYTTVTPSCVPGNDGSITVNVTGGIPPYQYSINGGAPQLGNTFNNLAAGTYTILVADLNDCKVILVVTLANSQAPIFTNVISNPANCFGANDGSINVTATGGLGVINYTLLPNNITNATGIFANLFAGTYTISAVDANSCSVSTIVVVTSPSALIWATLSNTNLNCNGDNNAVITSLVTGGTGIINYNLQAGNVNNQTGIFTNLIAGIYTLATTDANGCSLSTIITITQPTPVVWTTTNNTNVSCNGGNDATITVLANGGIGIMDYNLQPGNITNQTGLFTNLTAGVYTILAADANGCSISTTINITQPTPLIITNVTNTIPSCVPGNDGTITITASGGTPVYSYSIGGAGQAANIFTNVGTGNYTITVTDANNCTVTSVYAVVAPNAPIFTNATNTPVSCNGGNNGTISVTATGGAGGINYTLLPNNITNAIGNFTNLIAGIYTINAVDASNCSVSTTIQITEPTQLIWATLTNTNVSCNGGNNAVITSLVTGGTGIINYNLQAGNVNNQTGIFPNLIAGIYTLTATDANGCSLSTIITITQPTPVVWTTTNNTNVSCNGGNDATITVLANGGIGIMDYNLQPGNITNQTGLFTNLTAGVYTILAADANGCSISTTINITQPTPLIITNVTNTIPSCVPGNDGTITITASGGTPIYSYSIGGAGQAANIFTNVGTGNYTITVTDANNCTVTSVYAVVAPNAPIFTNATNTPVSCNGGSNGTISVTATGGAGGINYTLLPNNITNAIGNFTNLIAGIYTINAVDASNCSVSTTIQITEPTQLIWATLTNTNVSCNGGNNGVITSLVTGGTGIINYNLQAGNVNNQTGIFPNLIAGIYTLTATDANGCSLSTIITITQPTPVVWTTTNNTNVSCNGGNDATITVLANGGIGIMDYNLQPGNITNQTGLFTNLTAGVYTILAADANGCSISTTINITQPTPLIITNVTNTIPSCVPGNDGTITITASGGTPVYSYSIGGAGQAANIFTNVGTGNYTITVTDANNCTVTSVYAVVAPNAPIFTNATNTPVSCNGGSNGTISVTATGGAGGINYTLLPNNITNAIGNFTNLIAGIYTINAVDASNCSVSTTIQITEPTQLIWATLTNTNVSCNGGNNGVITSLVTGGTGIINYNLQVGNVNNQTGIFTNLIAGIYTLTATDANGCSISTTVAITQPTLVLWTTTSNTNVSCNGGNDATITVLANGGIGIMDYNLQPGNITNQTGLFTNLIVGVYTILAADANGCSISTTINITQPTPLIITNVTNTIPSCVPGNDGTITITASGGTPVYSYSIGGAGQAANIFTSIGTGTYTITVTDANNCTVTSVYAVVAPNVPIITNIATTNATCIPGCDATATITATGGLPTYSYSLDGITFQASNIYSNLCAGAYTATVKDASGCTSTSVFNIFTSTGPVITNTTVVNILCNGGNNGSITVLTTGGTGTIVYTLQPNNINNITGVFTNLIAGIYTVVIIDANGCGLNTIVNITEPPQLVFTNIVANGALCNGAQNGTIDVTTTGGTGVINYAINPAANFVPPATFNNLLGNITYTIVATDANGCSISTAVFVFQPPSLVIDSSFFTNISCNAANDGTINVYASGGTGILNYNLMPLAINNVTGAFTGLAPNTYTVTITDANNCTLSSIFIITQPTPITLVSINATNVSCNNAQNATITILCTGGSGVLNYNLQPTNVNNITGQFVGLGGGNYTITVTDANNCIYTTTIAVVNPPILSFGTFIVTNISCFGNNDGIINATAVGGTGILTYVLQPGNVVNGNGLFTGLLPGIYTVSVSDANLCSTSSVTTITEPLPLNAVLVSTQNVICHGGNTGAIVVSASGGNIPYVYTLNPTAVTNNTGDFQNVTAGIYTVTVTDINGCTTEVLNIAILEPPPIIFTTVSHVDVICYGDSTGSITVQASGGTGNIVYTISPALGTQLPLGFFAYLPARVYTVTATDAANCTLTTIVVVKQNNEIIITEVTWREPICYGDANGMVNFTAVGGVAPLTYHLDNNVGQVNGYFNNIIGGYHLLTITDSLGCRRDSLFLLPQPEPVHAGTLTIIPESCADAKDGQIIVVGAGGRGGYTYFIRPGLHVNKNGLFYGFEEGVYTLTIRDTSLCEWDTIINVPPPTNQLSIYITKKDLGCFGTGVEGWAQVNVTGGVSPYTYLWNTNPPQVTDRAINLFFGYYIVEVLDANGCKILDTVYIEPGPCCDEVFIPNAFSPNGDGVNDVFRVTTATGVELIQFDVYDRWGVRAWSTNDFRNGWDGTYKEERDANMNTFYYIFRYVCMTDGKIYTKKGDINLIR